MLISQKICTCLFEKNGWFKDLYTSFKLKLDVCYIFMKRNYKQ